MKRCRSFASQILTIAYVFGAAATTADALPPPDQKGPFNVGSNLFTAAMYCGRVTKIQVFYPTCAPCNPTSFYTVTNAAGNYQLRSQFGAAHDAPPARGPFPLIVHDHGGGGPGQDFQRLGQMPMHELLASHGFVVVVALHAGDPVVRVRDLPIVVSTMLARSVARGDLLFNSIDHERIGVSGNSAGGGAALGVTGGWVVHGLVPDTRIKAMAVYEPGILSMDDARNIRVPYLVMGGLIHRAGLAVPGLFAATTAAAPRFYVQTPNAAHFNYNTALPSELEQTREQALLAVPNIPEPLTTLTATNAAAARAYEIWNWGEILYPTNGPEFGSGRNFCDRVGVNSVRSLDLNRDGFTDSPPFKRNDPPYLTKPAIRAEEMIPIVNHYTVAFWKMQLQGDCRYQRFLAPTVTAMPMLHGN
jgi:dienelactone hydrolase